MKTNRFISFACAALALTLSVSSCKKEAEPNPDLAARISGKYTFRQVDIGGRRYDISKTNLAGGAEVIRETETTVTLVLDVMADKSPYAKGSATGITLTERGNGEVTLTKDSNEVGSGGNNTLQIRTKDTSGEAVILYGVK